jgi:salicylate hydroxylase
MTQDRRSARGSVRVVIVGGGIGGLTAALALHSAGADVGVYEQAAQLGEVGAGVQLFPNSMRVLQRLGVGEEVARHAAPVTEFWSFGSDGSVTGHQIAGVDGPITSMPM